MDLLNHSNKPIKVRIEELESNIRSKRDLYYVLRQLCMLLLTLSGQYYLPDERQCSIRFLKDVLSVKKKAYKIKNIKSVVVPQFDELRSKVMYKRIKGYYSEIIDHFPEYIENPEYLPPKKYMWDVFSTKNSSMAHKFNSHSLNECNRKDSEGERMVEVSEEVLNQLHSSHYFSKKKEKALFMLSASNELGTIKRKKQINEYNPLGIEEEKIQIKKTKKNEDRNKKNRFDTT